MSDLNHPPIFAKQIAVFEHDGVVAARFVDNEILPFELEIDAGIVPFELRYPLPIDNVSECFGKTQIYLMFARAFRHLWASVKRKLDFMEGSVAHLPLRVN